MIKVELCNYNGWEDCIKIRNDQIEVIATTKIGPRVLRFAFHGEENIFYEAAVQQGLTGGEDWRIYGGHRLWHGPQIGFRPNEPDNEPISYELLEDGVILTGNKEEKSGMRKQITLRVPSEKAEVQVTHSITNHSVWPVELTAWALTVMAGGGLAVWPNTKMDTGFLPNNALTIWPYTNLEDSRFRIKQNYMTLRQDNRSKDWFKVGTCNVDGWAAYLLNQMVFVKQYEHIEGSTYSDLGSSFEIYTDADIMELESLSPITRLDMGDTIHHKEMWQLIRVGDLQINSQTDRLDMEEEIIHGIRNLKTD